MKTSDVMHDGNVREKGSRLETVEKVLYSCRDLDQTPQNRFRVDNRKLVIMRHTHLP